VSINLCCLKTFVQSLLGLLEAVTRCKRNKENLGLHMSWSQNGCDF